MIVRQAPLSVSGRTQAESVIPLVRSSESASGTVTTSSTPSKSSAAPMRPFGVHVALVIVPLLPVPEASATTLPVPSSKPYPATSPGGPSAVVFSTVTVTPAEVAVSPARSRARALIVCWPLVAERVFHGAVYGAVVSSSPSGWSSSRNWTPATWSLSAASAATEIVPDTVAPAVGEVTPAVGGSLSHAPVVAFESAVRVDAFSAASHASTPSV
jgi:hypothetical protein